MNTTHVTFVTCCIMMITLSAAQSLTSSTSAAAVSVAAAVAQIGDLVNGINVDVAVNMTAFDKDAAKRFMYHSYAAYCPEKKIESWSCHWCKDSITNVTILRGPKTDSFGYVAFDRIHNQVIVSYRGSVSLVNWIENIKFWKADKPFDNVTEARVATGFYESYATVALATQKAVRLYLNANPTASLVVTGHSLGGALASLAAFDLKQVTGIASKDVYTFGSPRVGDAGFASAYNARVATTWRMTNHKDIVPHLPPKAFNFLHVSNEIFEVHGNYKTDCQGGEDKKCADGQLGDSVIDHLNYMQTFWLCL